VKEKFSEHPTIMQKRYKSRGNAGKEEKEILQYAKHCSKEVTVLTNA